MMAQWWQTSFKRAGFPEADHFVARAGDAL
jgi:hypothetical protein